MGGPYGRLGGGDATWKTALEQAQRCARRNAFRCALSTLIAGGLLVVRRAVQYDAGGDEASVCVRRSVSARAASSKWLVEGGAARLRPVCVAPGRDVCAPRQWVMRLRTRNANRAPPLRFSFSEPRRRNWEATVGGKRHLPSQPRAPRAPRACCCCGGGGNNSSAAIPISQQQPLCSNRFPTYLRPQTPHSLLGIDPALRVRLQQFATSSLNCGRVGTHTQLADTHRHDAALRQVPAGRGGSGRLRGRLWRGVPHHQPAALGDGGARRRRRRRRDAGARAQPQAAALAATRQHAGEPL